MPQIGIQIPLAAPDAQGAIAVEVGRRAEAAGAHSVWAADRLVYDHQDPILALTAVAATTTRVRIGTCIALAALRPPAWLAKMVATLDQISGGRMTLGIGAGGRPDDFEAAAVPLEHRGGRVEEIVKILKLAWSGEPVKHNGKFYHLDVGQIGPRPVQQPHPPIWFGGNSEPVFRRIARIGDGYIGTSTAGPDGFRANLGKIRRYAEAIGRDPATIAPACLVYACVDDDLERATTLASNFMRRYYGPSRPDARGVLLGTPDDCARGAEAFFDAGVQTLIIGSVTAELRYLDRLCQEVVPRLARG